MVEFALVAPLLVLILFAIVDFGIAYNDSQSVRQGARDGARALVTGNLVTGSTCTTTPATTGFLRDGICLTKARAALTDSKAKVRVALKTSGTCANGVAASSSKPCSGKGDPLAVCVQYPLTSTTGVFSPLLNGRYLRSDVVMRIEKPLPGSPGGSFEETGGGSWAWCPNPS